MSASRTKQHEIAMSIIYQCLMLINLGQTFDVKEVIASTAEEEYENVDIYIKQVVVSSLSHIDEIKAAFIANLRKWKFERLALLEQALLIFSYAHYYYVGGVDKKVVINVAVNLAKKYLDENDYKFVNAILENTLK